MYSVLIVDDEPVLRMGLSKMISWEECGFQIVGSVMNGRCALRFLEENQVDLVITDMKMPVMDGLELVYTLQKEEFPGVYVVLTNYSDFDFARESFRGGAVDYILKATLNPVELKECLKKVKEKLKNYGGRDEWVQKKKLDTDEKNIRDWLGNVLETAPALTAPFCGLCFFQSGKYHEKFKEYAENLFQSHILVNKNPVYKEEGKKFYCYYRNDATQGLLPHKVSERFVSLMKTYYNITVFSIIEKNLDSIQALVRFREGCEESEEFVFYSGFKDVFYTEECNQYKNRIKSDALNLAGNYQKTMKEGSFERAGKDLICGFELFLQKNPAPSAAKKWIKAVIEIILIDIRLYFDENREEYEQINTIFLKSNTYGDYIQFVGFLTHQLAHILKKFQKNRYREEISVIMKYAENHLSHRISLSEISKVVNMNESYISRMFKQETSMALMGYINMLKMEKAMELLKSPDFKIKDVMAMVGVEQQSYFNKIFNKYCDMNPLDYKKIHRLMG